MSRGAAPRAASAIKRHRIELLPYGDAIIREAERLRRLHDALGLFDAIHLATARAARETILTSDALFPLLDVVPVLSIPRVP